MRKDAKRASKSTQAKKPATKADVKDLAVKNPATVKGGTLIANDFSIMKRLDKSSV
jgi:hypothetical protein